MADTPASTASMDFIPPPHTSTAATTTTMDFSQLPLLPLVDDDGTEFDYAAFFPGDETTTADYLGEMDLAEDSSASASTNNVLTSEHSPLQSLSPQPPAQTVRSNTSNAGNAGNTQQKTRLERRGHTKSRRGCFNCKRRRIKVGY